MTPMIRAFFTTLVALVATALLALPVQAEARKRLVVLEVDGPGGERILRQLDQLLDQRHATVTEARFSQRARELDAEAPTDANFARVARHLALDGVVDGEIVERDDSYRLTVRLREGRTGAFVLTIAVRLESPELTRAAKRQISRMLMPAIATLPSVTSMAVDDDQRDERAPAQAPATPDDLDGGGSDGSEPSPPPAAPVEEASDRSERAAPSSETRENPRALASNTASAPPFEMYGGLSVSSRALTFSSVPGLDNPPQDYAGAVVPGVFINAELYPYAFSGTDASSRLGITAMLDRVLRIDSEVRYQDTVTSLPTSQSRAGAGLVYRHPFGDDDTSPVIKGSLRLSRLSFAIDRTPSPVEIDVPSVAYTFLDPGLWARYPLGSLAVFAEARSMLMLSTGEIQQIDQYGTTSVLGIDLELGLEYMLSDNLAARGGFRFTGISHDFAGDGQRTDRGGTSDVDVVGAHDRYVGGYLTVGYVY